MMVFDVETTNLLCPPDADLKDQPHIIEIGCVFLDDVTYKETCAVSQLIRPGIVLDEEEHKKITKLTNADLADAPTFADIFPGLCEMFVGEQKLIAHNCPFDMGVLVCELRRLNAEYAFPYPPVQICSAELSAAKFGRRYKLDEFYTKITGKAMKQTHRAVDDARALAAIVRKLKL